MRDSQDPPLKRARESGEDIKERRRERNRELARLSRQRKKKELTHLKAARVRLAGQVAELKTTVDEQAQRYQQDRVAMIAVMARSIIALKDNPTLYAKCLAEYKALPTDIYVQLIGFMQAISSEVLADGPGVRRVEPRLALEVSQVDDGSKSDDFWSDLSLIDDWFDMPSLSAGM